MNEDRVGGGWAVGPYSRRDFFLKYPLPSVAAWHSAKALFAQCQAWHSAKYFCFILNFDFKFFCRPYLLFTSAC